MSPDTSQVVERMYEVLLDEIRTHRPELLDEGFTVAEIYQNLVPYRTHRDRIGIEMNGDYEHALLRLLVGEGGYVELESDAARRRLQEELDSVHPDTGVYRNFAACEVRLAGDVGPAPEGSDEWEVDAGSEGEEGVETGRAPGSSSNGDGGSAAEDESIEEADAGPADDGAGEAQGSAPGEPEERVIFDVPGSEAEAEAGSGPDSEDEAETPMGTAEPDSTCQWCRERLPEREDLRFCPFCGSRVDRVPCPECGTELEEEWLFCVACGTHVED